MKLDGIIYPSIAALVSIHPSKFWANFRFVEVESKPIKNKTPVF